MMENIRSPMDNLSNMLSRFSTGHEKALKQGIYNAVALLLLCLVSAASYGLYIILSRFIKPLVWALLCGSVLFPFKCSLATAVESWFDNVETSNQPLVISLTLLPVQIIDQVSEGLGSFLWKYVKYVAAFALTSVSILGVYHYTPIILTSLLWRIFMLNNAILNFFISTCNIYMITIVLIGYMSVLLIYWTPKTSIHFRYPSFVVWFMISLYVSNLVGMYQMLVFMTLQGLGLVGFIYEVILIMEDQELEDRHMTMIEAVRFALTNNLVTPQHQDTLQPLPSVKPVKNVLERQEAQSTDVQNVNAEDELSPLKVESTSNNAKLSKKSMSLDAGAVLRNRYLLGRLRKELSKSIELEYEEVDTDKYMYGALYACIGMLIWNHRWVIFILTIPIAIYTLKKLGSYFGIWTVILQQLLSILDIFKSWCLERHQALLPANIRGLYRVSIIADQKLTTMLKSSVSAVATTAVILGLIVFTTCTSIFITIQAYSESMHMIQVMGEIVNSTLVNNPDIDWLPEQWEDSVNSVLDNAYTYGRSAISDGVKGLVKDLEPSKAEQMERKVLELWDRLYQAWMMSNSSPDLIGPTVDVAAAYSVWESFTDSYGKTPMQLFNMTSLQNFVKDNIGTFMSVLDSIWGIVKGNMSVILTLFSELFYIVLMSGTAVFNFVLSMVVFFTTLFYLLNSSNKTYKPVELTTMFSPISCHRYVIQFLLYINYCFDKHSNIDYVYLSALLMEGFAVALQEAVIGVFAATFKQASFFGMWTWFVHHMFQVKVVYLPAAFATILGAVPFLDAYFACIPATVELWVTRGPMMAVLFFLFHFLPCNIVVTEFYKEIRGGGHPYLTGLSIAGGIFCLGVEGAIFGPVLLCCIMVAINLSRRYLHSPSEDIRL